MRNLGLLGAIIKIKKYEKMSQDKREIIKQERLRTLIEYARNNSPYYHKLYENIPTNYSLKNLPTTNKVDLMGNFDSWMTNRSIKFNDINIFMSNIDNRGRKFAGKYFVFTTSGFTGLPTIVLYDKSTKSVMDAIRLTRSFAYKKDMFNFIKGGFKCASMHTAGIFSPTKNIIKDKLNTMIWKNKKLLINNILNKTKYTVYKLNYFQPIMLEGNPTSLEILSKERNLNIHPKIIMTDGEPLQPKIRKSLENTFKCHVESRYYCTEGGIIACECSEKHYHLNDDWIIMEPVDKDNNPVEDGQLADKWLLTNLSNYTQPLIRYEITDRVILHKEKCFCGKSAPWIEVIGRSDGSI